jgi:hypothetical protein
MRPAVELLGLHHIQGVATLYCTAAILPPLLSPRQPTPPMCCSLGLTSFLLLPAAKHGPCEGCPLPTAHHHKPCCSPHLPCPCLWCPCLAPSEQGRHGAQQRQPPRGQVPAAPHSQAGVKALVHGGLPHATTARRLPRCRDPAGGVCALLGGADGLRGWCGGGWGWGQQQAQHESAHKHSLACRAKGQHPSSQQLSAYTQAANKLQQACPCTSWLLLWLQTPKLHGPAVLLDRLWYMETGVV